MIFKKIQDFFFLISPSQLSNEQFGTGLEDLSADLNVVGGEDSPQIKHLQHRRGAVIGDAVALQGVFSDQNLPGQPALPERSIKGQQMGEMTRLTATTAFIFFNSLCYRLHLPLLAIRPWDRERKKNETEYFN